MASGAAGSGRTRLRSASLSRHLRRVPSSRMSRVGTTSIPRSSSAGSRSSATRPWPWPQRHAGPTSWPSSSAGFAGTLQVDGYVAYKKLGDPNRVGGPLLLANCWCAAQSCDSTFTDFGSLTASGNGGSRRLRKVRQPSSEFLVLTWSGLRW